MCSTASSFCGCQKLDRVRQKNLRPRRMHVLLDQRDVAQNDVGVRLKLEG
jgi:hypothetical protein